MRIVSLDPGGETGYVVWDRKVVFYGQLIGAHHQELWRLLSEQGHGTGDLLVICERFDHRNAEFAKLVSVEYIGIVRLYQQTIQAAGGAGHVVWQGSSVKKWADNAKLQKMELLLRPIKPMKDANDAMRHLVHYICHYGGSDSDLISERDRLLERLKPGE